MIVKIKLEEGAIVPFKKHANDFCYDLVATSCEEIAPNVYKYGTGIHVQCDHYKGSPVHVGFLIHPRSSVWQTGMMLSNCVGVVDEGYTGEISAVFYHVMPNLPKYKVGDRIGQLRFQTSEDINWDNVMFLDETERGEGGYGSTGKQ